MNALELLLPPKNEWKKKTNHEERKNGSKSVVQLGTVQCQCQCQCREHKHTYITQRNLNLNKSRRHLWMCEHCSSDLIYIWLLTFISVLFGKVWLRLKGVTARSVLGGMTISVFCFLHDSIASKSIEIPMASRTLIPKLQTIQELIVLALFFVLHVEPGNPCME